jgi:glycosyltransferase involved in cell wall biosynthesis
VQNKVLEAVAAGLPVVVTPAVYEGLPDTVRPACRVASSAANFANEISDLLRLSREDLRAVASRASIEALTWENSLAPLGGMLARMTA